MAQRGRKKAVFVIDEVKLKVATAIAKGDRALSDILTEYKIPERTFYRWKKEPEFQLKIDEIIADIDISMKSERIKIAKKELKRVLARLELDEDKPKSSDVVALLRFIGDEVGDLSEHKDVNLHGEGVIFYIPENNRNKPDPEPTGD